MNVLKVSVVVFQFIKSLIQIVDLYDMKPFGCMMYIYIYIYVCISIVISIVIVTIWYPFWLLNKMVFHYGGSPADP